MTPKRAATWIIGVVGVLALVVIGGIVVLTTLDLRPVIERFATRSLHRQLTIGALRIGWGDPLSIEARDVTLANASWGSDPAMLRVEHVSAQVDLWPLLGGVLQYRKLRLDKPMLLLERDAEGKGNWHFSETKPAKPEGFAVMPKDRTQFPTLIDFAIGGGLVTLRSSSGRALRLDLRQVAIRSTGADRPVSVALEGGYNDTPVHLTGDTQSFDVMRNGSVPFGATFSLTTPTAASEFKGTLTDPLNFDGVTGALDIRARTLGDLLKIFGAETEAGFPMQVSGTLHREGDHWQLQESRGNLAANGFRGALALDEGGRGQPDDVGIDLAFALLDLKPLLGGGDKSPASANGGLPALSLRLEAKRDTNIDARITAAKATYGTTDVADLAFHGRLGSALAEVSEMNFTYAEGKVSATGSARGVAKGSRVTAQAAVTGADAGQMARLIGSDADQLAGRLTAEASMEMTGATVQDALKASRGHAVLAMNGGRVARAFLEKASTDLRALFRDGEGSARLTCVLGILELTNGIGTIAPFRLRTSETSLAAGGTVDLVKERLDVTVRAEAASGSLFALRIPLHITGGFAAPSVSPAIGSPSPSPTAQAMREIVRGLPPEQRQLAEHNSCLQ